MKKRLLIVWHSQSGGAARMCEAVERGARTIDETETLCRRAFDATADDLRGADGLVVGTPENFGYMSGAVKDFFDRTFYPCEHDMAGKPWAIFVRAGNDGRGAVASVERILAGLAMKRVVEPVIARGPIDEAVIAQCEELGATMAAGLAFGMF